jgi:predicted dehydrogenase
VEDYHFLHAIKTGVPLKPDFDVAVKAHEIVEAIYRSARTNNEVRLPL